MHVDSIEVMRARVLLGAVLAATLGACGDETLTATADLAGQSSDAAAADQAPGVVLASCPTSGKGAIVAPAACHVFTAARAGASATSANASDDEYALEPAVTPRGTLVIHLNGSLGTPAGQIADPAKNLYNALAGAGFHVLGLSYASDQVIGAACNNVPDCFAPTRLSVLLGVYQTGGAAGLKGIAADAGILARVEAALRLLVAASPGAGWDQFLDDVGNPDPKRHVAWSKVIASGHSQGGGHAAFMATQLPILRAVQLSSTCDAVGMVPAPWTASTATWVTSPTTSLVGFAAPTTFDAGGVATGGDQTCPYHLKVWQNMGMDASRMHDDAATCGGLGNTHGASIGCSDNFSRWAALYE